MRSFPGTTTIGGGDVMRESRGGFFRSMRGDPQLRAQQEGENLDSSSSYNPNPRSRAYRRSIAEGSIDNVADERPDCILPSASRSGDRPPIGCPVRTALRV